MDYTSCRWPLDYQFAMDRLVRRLCMNLARLHPAKDSVRGKLKDAAWDDDFREQLLFGIND